MPWETRGHWIPWNQSYRRLWATRYRCCKLHPGLPKEWQLVITTDLFSYAQLWQNFTNHLMFMHTNIHIYMCVYIHTNTYIYGAFRTWYACGGQRTSCGSWLIFSFYHVSSKLYVQLIRLSRKYFYTVIPTDSSHWLKNMEKLKIIKSREDGEMNPHMLIPQLL